MQTLRARYDRLADVPVAHRAFYRLEDKAKGQDSPVTLAVESADGFELAHTAKLTARADQAEHDRDRARTRLATYRRGDAADPDALWDPAEIAKLAARAAAAPDPDAVRIQIETAVAQETSARTAAEQALAKLRERHHATLLEHAADDALGELRVLPNFRKLMRREMLDALTVEVAGDAAHVRVRSAEGKGARMIQTADSRTAEPMTAAQFALDVRQRFPTFFAGDGASGAGINQPTRSTSGGNRFRITASALARDTGQLPRLEAEARAAGQQVEVVPG